MMMEKKQAILIFLAFLKLATSSSNSDSNTVDTYFSGFCNVSIDNIMKEMVENKSWTNTVHRKNFTRARRGACSISQMYGGSGGSYFQDPCSPENIGSVKIRSGGIVDSVQLIYRNDNGQKWAANAHGGSGGKLHTINLDTYEYIVAVVGFYGESKWCENCINQLGFITANENGNHKKHGPYGEKRGDLLLYTGEVGGFYGRSGKYLDAIGFLI